MSTIRTVILCLGLTFVLIGCSNETESNASKTDTTTPAPNPNYKGISNLFEFQDPNATGVLFQNEIRDSLQMLCFTYEYAFNGGGVAVGDINNDGLQDLFFTGTLSPNRLYLNMGNWKFRDISVTAGINNNMGTNIGTSMIDINNDGLMDIYVCKSGTMNNPEARRNCLYINQGNLTFKNEAKAYGLDDPSFSTQAYFADYDLDGDLDVYCVNHPINWGNESNLNLKMNSEGDITVMQDTQRVYVTDRYLVNNNGKFVDKTFDSEVDNAAFGLSGIVNDFNDDGYPDVYICNDYSKPDRLMINQKGEGFKDEILSYFDNITASSMGSDLWDVNNDGKMDLFVNDMMHEDINIIKQQQSYLNYDLALIGRKYGYHDQFKYNSLQVKMEDGKYSNMAYLTDTDKTGWSWAVLSEDYDHNGHSDLFIVNGYLKDVTNMDYSKFKLDSLRRTSRGKPVGELYDIWSQIIDSLYTPNYFFSNQGGYDLQNVSYEWNAGKPSFSNGAAFADLDNDGDLDLIVNNINDPAFLMKNTLSEQSQAKSLRIKLESNKSQYGSTVIAHLSDGSKLAKYYYPMRGFVSSVEQIIHYGIPTGKSINKVEVKWLNGQAEEFDVVGKTGITSIVQGSGKKTESKTVLTDIKMAKSELGFNHVENEFIDFKREPLLHMKHSVEGPALEKGDFNGDGQEDLVVGGAYQQQIGVWLTNNGQLTKKNSEAFKASSDKETFDLAVGDFDKDGDLDIAALCGGYQWNQGANQYGVQLYLNDGKGTFTLKDITTSLKINANAISTVDYDQDKDLDLVIGAGAIPGSYPHAANSYILKNDGGNFNFVENVLPNEGKFGIVKDVVSQDINNDGKDDLILVGEWEAISILINEGGAFTDKQDEYGFSDSKGLWQDVKLADLDNDGDIDIICGNLGLNSFFKTSKEKPTCIYASDFDNNGENDPILCTYFGEQAYPVHSRDELLDQMTSYRKKYLRYAPFAKATITDLFGKDKVSKASVFSAYTFANTAFINEGSTFKAIELPKEAQVSVGQSMALYDIDGNGTKEILFGGNYWDTDFDFGKYDASVGNVMSYDATNGFTCLPNYGFIANKNVREFKVLNDELIVIANNDGPVEVYRRK